MDVKEIRAINAKLNDIVMSPEGWNIVDEVDAALATLEALVRLEAREAELVLDTAEIVERIRGVLPHDGMLLSREECGALIGQYAYRYSEDIRKERDKWKALAEKFRDAVNEMGAV